MENSYIHVMAWTQDGFKVGLNLLVNTPEDIQRALDGIRGIGLSPREPGIQEGEETETIHTVVRRQHTDNTPIIDFYPEWSHSGKYGANKYAHMYLNTPEDIAQFEAQSGLRLTDIPLFDGNAAITRVYGKPKSCEKAVERTFDIAKKKVGQHENGMPKYEYRFARPLTVTPPSSTPSTGGQNTGNGDPVGGKPQAGWVDKDALAMAHNAVMVQANKHDLSKADFVALAGLSNPMDFSEWFYNFPTMAELINHCVGKLKPAQPKGNGKAGNGSDPL